MPGCRSEVSDGHPNPFFALSMATKDNKMMPCDPAAREQRVTAANPKEKRKSRSRQKKARDGSSSAPARDDGRDSPTVDIEREGDKKVTQKTKKAGEGSSNARC